MTSDELRKNVLEIVTASGGTGLTLLELKAKLKERGFEPDHERLKMCLFFLMINDPPFIEIGTAE